MSVILFYKTYIGLFIISLVVFNLLFLTDFYCTLKKFLWIFYNVLHFPQLILNVSRFWQFTFVLLLFLMILVMNGGLFHLLSD